MFRTLAAQVGNPVTNPPKQPVFPPFVEAWKGDAYATQEFCRHGGANFFCHRGGWLVDEFFSQKNMQSCKDPVEFS